jgi:hypothetical protein
MNKARPSKHKQWTFDIHWMFVQKHHGIGLRM